MVLLDSVLLVWLAIIGTGICGIWGKGSCLNWDLCDKGMGCDSSASESPNIA